MSSHCRIIPLLCAMVAATAHGQLSVSISGPSDFLTPCPDKKYHLKTSETAQGSITDKTYSWTTNGALQGSGSSSEADIVWSGTSEKGYVQVAVSYYLNGNAQTPATKYESVDIRWSPNNANPTVDGASAMNPNYVPVNAPAAFSVAPIPNASLYQWTLPSCFSGASSVTSTPHLNVGNSGVCGGAVSVNGYDAACGYTSATTWLAIVRVPKLGGIIGPDAFCHLGSGSYSVEPIAGIAAYEWTVPSGWKVTPLATDSHSIKLQEPNGNNGTIAGVISVRGSVPSNGYTNPQSKNVQIDLASPTTIAAASPTITVSSSPSAGKKRINVVFPRLSFKYHWTIWVRDRWGSNVTYQGLGGGSRDFLMTNGQQLMISEYTVNGCGETGGNDYAYRLNGSALVPQQLQ